MTNEELVMMIQGGDDRDGALMLQLWKQNRGLIFKIANDYSSRAEIDDLGQEGYIGLCHAANHFDQEAGAAFGTYAAFWIRNSISRYAADCAGAIRIPHGQRARMQQYKRFCAAFLGQIGREPTEREAADGLGLSRDQIRDIRQDIRTAATVSADQAVSDDGGDVTIGDLIPGETDVESDVVEEIYQDELKAALWRTVDSLPGNQGDIIRMRYQEGKTAKECGAVLGMDAQRIYGHEKKGLETMARGERRRVLLPFVEDRIYNRALKGNGIGAFNRTWTSSTERVALDLCTVV